MRNIADLFYNRLFFSRSHFETIRIIRSRRDDIIRVNKKKINNNFRFLSAFRGISS